VSQPPQNLIMPAGAQSAFLIMAGVLLAVGLAVGIRHLVSRRDPVLLYLLLGGAIASLFEPIVDILGLMYIPEKGAATVFSFFDRGMPLFVVVAYAGYIGGLAYIAYHYLQRGITPIRVLRIWGVFLVANIGFETPAVLLNVYSYYGNQPLNLWGFPLWWAFVNPLTSIVAGALLVHLHQPLKQRNALLAVPLLVPMACGMSNGAAAAPVWLSLNGDLPGFVPWIAAAVTLGLALFVVWIIGTALAYPAPSVAADSAGAGIDLSSKANI
jgi:hypothetical protein